MLALAYTFLACAALTLGVLGGGGLEMWALVASCGLVVACWWRREWR